MKEGFYVNGAHSCGTHRLRTLSRSVSSAPKDDYTERVPFSNRVYDFGGIYGRQSYGERKLNYQLEFVCMHRKKAQDRLIRVLKWLRWRGSLTLYDDLLPDYHYSVREPEVTWSEEHGAYRINVTFPAAPEISPNSNKPDNSDAVGLPDGIQPWDVTLPDVNGDGRVNAVDVSAILSAYSKISTGQESGLTAEQLRAADANMDGRITSADASLVMGFYTALSTGKYECSAEGWAAYLNDRKNSEGVV